MDPALIDQPPLERYINARNTFPIDSNENNPPPPYALDPPDIETISVFVSDEEQHASSSASISSHHESTISKTDYAVLLSAMPAIKQFTYSSSDSDDNGNINLDELAEDNCKEPDPRHVGGVSAAMSALPATSGLRLKSPNSELPSKVKAIEHHRDELLQAQMEVEDTGARLSQIRRNIEREIGRATPLRAGVSNKPGDAEVHWDKCLLRLRHFSNELAQSEKVLLRQQRSVTLAHTKFRSALDELYASLTNGARLDDSETSFEDRALDLSHLRHASSETTSSGRGHFSSTRFATAYKSHRDTLTQVGQLSSTSGGADGLAGRRFRAHRQRLAMPSDPYPTTKIKVKETTRLNSRTVDRQTWSRPALVQFGCHLDSVDTQEGIDAAESDEMLNASKAIKQIRREDLRPELGIGAVFRKRKEAEDTAELLAEPRRNIAQKLSKINVPSFNIDDWIDMWGSTMSQDTWVEFQRTVLYNDILPALHHKGRMFRLMLRRYDAAVVVPLTDFLRVLVQRSDDESTITPFTDFLRILAVASYPPEPSITLRQVAKSITASLEVQFTGENGAPSAPQILTVSPEKHPPGSPQRQHSPGRKPQTSSDNLQGLYMQPPKHAPIISSTLDESLEMDSTGILVACATVLQLTGVQ